MPLPSVPRRPNYWLSQAALMALATQWHLSWVRSAAPSSRTYIILVHAVGFARCGPLKLTHAKVYSDALFITYPYLICIPVLDLK